MPGLADVPPRPRYGVRFGSGAAEVTSTPSTRAPTACAPLPSPASTRWISALSRRHKGHERPPRAAPPRLTAMLRGRTVAVNGHIEHVTRLDRTDAAARVAHSLSCRLALASTTCLAFWTAA